MLILLLFSSNYSKFLDHLVELFQSSKSGSSIEFIIDSLSIALWELLEFLSYIRTKHAFSIAVWGFKACATRSAVHQVEFALSQEGLEEHSWDLDEAGTMLIMDPSGSPSFLPPSGRDHLHKSTSQSVRELCPGHPRYIVYSLWARAWNETWGLVECREKTAPGPR